MSVTMKKRTYNEMFGIDDIAFAVLMIGAAILFGKGWRNEVKDAGTRQKIMTKLSNMFSDPSKYEALKQAVVKTYSPSMASKVTAQLNSAKAKYEALDNPTVQALEEIITGAKGPGAQSVMRAADMERKIKTSPAAETPVEESVNILDTRTKIINNLKYTDAQINRLFIEGSDSVLERAAHVAKAAYQLGRSKGERTARPKKMIAEGVFDDDNDSLDDGEGGIDKASDLMDSLFGPLDQIKSLLSAAGPDVIDILLDHLADLAGMDEEMAEQEEEYRMMAAVIQDCR